MKTNFKYSVSTFILCFISFFTLAQNALSLDGSNDYVNCGNGSSVQITGTSLTLEAWVYPTFFKTNVWQGTVVSKSSGGSLGIDRGYMLRIGNGGQVNFNIGTGNWREINSAVGAVSLNNWHHIAGTYDGDSMILYVNGAEVARGALSASIGNATNGLFIGEDAGFTNRTFPGSIDEVRVWNVARTPAEIQSAMNSEFCGSIPGLVAYYNFNQGIAGGANSGLDTLIDVTGNNNGLLLNFALSGGTSNWIAGKNLNLPSAVSDTIRDSLCNKYTYSFGTQIIDKAGIYTETYQRSVGCDSIVVLVLEADSIDASASINGISFLANNPSASSYQWINCDQNNVKVMGAVNRTFFPNTNDFYAVIVSDGDCQDTSNCISRTQIGIDENSKLNISLYPNPSAEIINISLPSQIIGSEFNILSIDGSVVYQSKLESSEVQISHNLTPGIYICRIRNKSYEIRKQLVIGE